MSRTTLPSLSIPDSGSGSGSDPERELGELRVVRDVAVAASGERDLKAILGAALDNLARVIGFTGGSIALVEGDELVIRAARGPLAEAALGQRLPRGRGLSWRLLDARVPFLSNDLVADGVISLSRAGEVSVRSWLGVPLVWHEEVLGLLEVDSIHAGAFHPLDTGLLTAVAAVLGGPVQLAKQYAAAERAVRARDEVLGMVSHDLRNPVNAAYMASSLLLDLLPDDESRSLERRHLEIIRRSAERMTRMIQDLLDVASMDAGSLSMAPASHPVHALLEEAAEACEGTARGAGVTLRVAGPEPGLHAHVDRERILQVLSNLLGNAVKFSPAGGEVELRAAAEGDRVRFEVRDKGPGIPPEHLPRLFDRFWQASPLGRGGVGLGLAIARGIVEAHGGRIGVESEPGAGSRFWFEVGVGEGNR